MATRTIFNVADAFFCVLGPDLVWLMFVTAIAGVAFESASDMAGSAGSLMRSGQREETRMIEACWFPCSLPVALRAIFACLSMNRNRRGQVTCCTLAAHFRSQQIVREGRFGHPCQSRAAVAGMTGHAIGL